MSKVSALYHIVFCTKNRDRTIPLQYVEDICRFIWNLLKEQKCKLIRINGVENHFHMLIDVNPTRALSDVVRDVKARTSGWMRKDSRFGKFENWASGYYACTLAPKDKIHVIEYIKNQQEHHGVSEFKSELETMCREAGMELFADELI